MKTKVLKNVSRFAKWALMTVCVFAIVVSSCFIAFADAGAMDTVYVDWYALNELVSVEKNEKSFVINAKVNGETEKLTITFPAFGGFRLNGEQKGFFDVEADDVNSITYKENLDGTTTVSAGNGTILVFNPQANPWAFQVFNSKGNMVAQYAGDQIWYGYNTDKITNDTEHVKVKIEAGLSTDEVIYGMGERFNSFDRVGIKTEMWNRDSWSQGDTSYKNIPIFHSSIGYMLFFNSGAGGTADIGATDPDKYSLDFATPKLDFFFWTGTPLQNINSYSSLTGTPILLPEWASRYWAGAGTAGWESSGSANSLKLLRNSMNGYKELGITDLAAVYGESAFNSNAQAYNIVRATNTRLLAWNYPFHNRSTQQMYLASDPNISTSPKDWFLPSFRDYYSDEVWGPGEYLDFSHPNVKAVIEGLWGKDIEYGLKGLMLDYGEGVYADCWSYSGLSGYEMHNFYAYYYHKAFYEVFQEKTGGTDFVLFGRNAAPGSQVYAAQFAGDQQGTYAGLTQAVNGLLSFSASGFSSVGSDIGGLGGKATEDLWCRWLQFATFSPLMRTHGTDGAEVPWEIGNTDNFLDHYWFRENILGKVYSANVAANKYGKPAAQAMAVAFPGKASTVNNQDQYMFCDDFLFCPVLSNTYYRSVDLPLGNWTDLHTGKIYEGGKTYKVDAPLDYSPTFIRQGSAIPVEVSKDTISLFDNMTDGNSVSALLVTAPNGSRTTEYWSDSDNRTLYTNTAIGNDSFSITADKAQDEKLIFAYGINAEDVTVDGQSLTKLSELPVSESAVGYYVDSRLRTVIRVPADKAWTNVTIKAGKSLDVDYALNKKLTYHDTAAITSDSKPEYINDNDPSTAWIINRIQDAYFEIDLEKIYEINEIVLKWTELYASAYSIELSSDGNEWVTLGYFDDCDGNIDSIKFSPTYARYIRVVSFTANTGNTVGLHSFNVYGTGAIGEVPDMSDLSKDESMGGSNYGGYVYDADNAQDEEQETVKKVVWKKTTKKKKNKANDSSVIPLWVIIVCIIVAVVIIAGIVLFIILKRRKKNKVMNS